MMKKILLLMFGMGLFLAPAIAMDPPKNEEAQQKLFQAVRETNMALLGEALLEGADVNALSEDPFEMNALHRILDNEEPLTDVELAIFEKLVDHQNTNINAPSGAGRTPLYLAARHGNKKAVEKLLEKGAVVTIADLPGKWTPLHAAAFGGHPEIIDLLLKKEETKPSIKDNEGNTPLHTIVKRSVYFDPSIVNTFVVDYEADITATNNEGETPLHIASEKDAGFVEALLKVAKDKGVLEELLNARDAQGRTALHRAISFNLNPKIVKLLLDAGVSATEPDSTMKTPFHYLALAMSSRESSLYPKQNKEVEMKEFVEVANMLLASQGDPTVQDDEGNSAIDLATGPYTEGTFRTIAQ